MTSISLIVDIANPSLPVPPMLLVTFVENCFKHGVSPVEESRISITLTESEGHLTLLTRNRIFPVSRIGEHLGIDNCRKRLELLYPGHHTLEIADDGVIYHINLQINLSR